MERKQFTEHLFQLSFKLFKYSEQCISILDLYLKLLHFFLSIFLQEIFYKFFRYCSLHMYFPGSQIHLQLYNQSIN